MVAKSNESAKLLNSLHFNNTKARRILISPMLNKNFFNMVEKQKRDKYLYASNLADVIKASQELKNNTQQIKNVVPRPPSY